MPRRKATDQQELLSHNLIIRVSEPLYNKLEKMRKSSGELSIAEICRKILTNQRIKLYQIDITMNPIMEELAMIRKELKSIGININQITRSFNQDKEEKHYKFHVSKVAEEYQKVDAKVEKLLNIISKLADKWLQK